MLFRPTYILFCIFIMFSFQLSAQLAVTYTMDAGSGGDYLSFSGAVTDLVALGVSAPVVFEVASGTYTEQISIPVGSSAVHAITFESPSLDSTDVVLDFPSQTTTAFSELCY